MGFSKWREMFPNGLAVFGENQQRPGFLILMIKPMVEKTRTRGLKHRACCAAAHFSIKFLALDALPETECAQLTPRRM
jgi:hypothetical protein